MSPTWKEKELPEETHTSLSEYTEAIRELFSTITGGGLILSEMDFFLIEGWHFSGIPIPVLLRGIEKGCRRWWRRKGGPAPSIARVRQDIEREIRRYVKRALPPGISLKKALPPASQVRRMAQILSLPPAIEAPGLADFFYKKAREMKGLAKELRGKPLVNAAFMAAKAREEILRGALMLLPEEKQKEYTLMAEKKLARKKKRMSQDALKETKEAFVLSLLGKDLKLYGDN